MEGQFKVHRVTCQACQAIHVERDARKTGPGESLFVVDRSPEGYEPDPRMMPKFED